MNLIIGAILGFISVAFGAYAEHGLKSQISAEHFEFIMTAIRYNQTYAIVISGIGIALLSSKSLSRCLTLKLSNLFFIVGTILFSFSIYISVVYNIPIILKLAPLGGTTLMIGWLMLILAAVFLKKNLKRSL
ncbi:DUF423 domain-containing protein [Francisella philomiragia]|uniref:DUF423 domain-containing protein n=2 Tax=Francisella TaxID=262 RepID=A0AAW3DCX9_9GAMM|nr:MULTISPECIES: DUF423 domain-containing protein [Francisella]AJI55278.1 hypothetical protein LA56_1722 [Francisella philomiragia]AJI56888.1 hypothetical protein LA02_63 [Francisella philomiragia]AJI75763.1 hypothetical protein BZ13_1599 [Francisella philomiragia subsp. philomiragia ATCC 25015]EET20217.1 conserved hypothetical protein [Francisella philomiragia subsp. philomiragia ATCC 25015]KFJ43630.1 hypothetical protein DR78_1248 [Francisella philomiragia]